MAVSTSATPYTDLAQKILENAKRIDAYLTEHKLPAPSFEEDSTLSLPPVPEVVMTKMALQDDILDLQLLTAGPGEMFSLLMLPVNHSISCQSIETDLYRPIMISGCSTSSISSKSGMLFLWVALQLMKKCPKRQVFPQLISSASFDLQ
jgi:hypothetical protein